MNEGEFNEKMLDLAFLLQLFTNAIFEKVISRDSHRVVFIVLEAVIICKKVPIITKA